MQQTPFMGDLARRILDAFFLLSIVGIVIYIILDGTDTINFTEIESPIENFPELEFRDFVKVCSNGKDEILEPTPETYELTGLDEYVWRKDGAFGYEIVDNNLNPITGIQTITVNFTSQEWLKEVDWHQVSTGTKVWWHWMVIYVPLERDQNEIIFK